MNTNNHVYRLLIIVILFFTSSQFALQGQYNLQMVHNILINMPVKIESFIFRKTTIMHKVTFLTCNSLMYQMQVQNDNIFLNIDTQYIVSQSQCTQNQKDNIVDIQKYIRRVFHFGIYDKKVIFRDIFGQEIFLFTRIINRQLQNQQILIKGSWQISLSQNSNIKFLMVANQTHFSICQETIYSYSFSKPYFAKISLAQNDRCNYPFVNQILSSAQFYRNIDNTLKIFDKDINQIAVGEFRQDINRQIKTAVILTPLPIQEGSKTFKNQNYIALLLYRRDLPRIRVKITNSILQLTLCTKLLFKIQEIGQKGLKISSDSTPDLTCRRDEQLYFNFFISITSYSTSDSNTITLLDADNKQVISLTS